MTVCIAALSEGNKSLVFVSDSKASFGDFSADRAIEKNIPFLPNWIVMLAGNDVSYAGSVIRRARKQCISRRLLADPDGIAQVLYDECKSERNRIVESRVLSKHNFTLEDFKAKGKKLCTESVYYDLYSRVEHISLSLSFLLCGFDEHGHGHIRYVDTDTPPQDYDLLGFYAIGSGANAALSSLCHSFEYLGLSRDSEVGMTGYHALAAKFMAESASDVGKDTWLVVLKFDSDACYITPFCGMDYIRKRWELQGGPRVPKKIDTAISDLLMTTSTALSKEGIKRAMKYSPKKLRHFKQFVSQT